MADGLFGVSAALATPFDRAGAVNIGALIDHADWCLESGCDRVTLFGTTGEGPSIGHSERREILSAVTNSAMSDRSFSVAVMTNAIEDAVDDIRLARDHGASAVLILPPFYFKEPGDDGVAAWFGRVFDRLGTAALPTILYHIPGLSQVPLSAALIGRLRRDLGKMIIGVKDSSGDWAGTQSLIAAHKDIAILVGDERHLASAVRLGAQGTISGLANLHPDRLKQVVSTGLDDPVINGLAALVSAGEVVPEIKALLAEKNDRADWAGVRPPLKSLNEASAVALLQASLKLDTTKTRAS